MVRWRGSLALIAAATMAAPAGAAEICGIDAGDVPANCLTFQNSCPVLQTCVINQQLRNEDIPNARLRDTVLVPLDDGPESQDAATVSATPEQPITVGSADNPLVSDACRRDVVRSLEEELVRGSSMSATRARQMLRSHLEDMRSTWAERGWEQLRPAEVFAHVAECREFCGPLITQLAQCHVWAVSASPAKTLLTFEVRRHEWSQVYHQHPLGIESVVERLKARPDSRVAVIGRASRDGNERFNQHLSYLRSHTVRGRLIDAGVEAERISLIWLGEQPPRIGSGVADAYGLSELYRSLGSERLLRINRSVMVVVYASEGLRHAHHQAAGPAG